ncbi:MAG: class I SAM-dependent methyltransferase [Nanoarchaeota archaeon]|nr:class I SAM-dependent methyltransferase [Nanoarchaeota archaeon]
MAKNWDNYWKQEGKTSIFTLVREKIIASELSSTLSKYFPKEGLFLDAGSGSSETSLKIKNRKIIALDLSHLVLKKVNKNLPIDSKVNANILSLPFKNNSIDGIFNLGVMEHFHKEDIIKILNEFYRTLKKDSYCILFWPSVYGPINLIFSSLGFIFRKQFFPDEVSLYRNKPWLNNILKETNFKLVKIRWSLKGALIYHEVILKK